MHLGHADDDVGVAEFFLCRALERGLEGGELFIRKALAFEADGGFREEGFAAVEDGGGLTAAFGKRALLRLKTAEELTSTPAADSTGLLFTKRRKTNSA